MKRLSLAGASLLAVAIWSAPASSAPLDHALAIPSARPDAALDQAAAGTHAEAIRGVLAELVQGADRRDRAIASEVLGFYEERDFRPAWLTGERPKRQARRLVERLRDAAEDGLDPEDYNTPPLAELGDGDDAELAAADAALSFQAARYAAHLAAGRVAPSAISATITQNPEQPDPAAVLADLAGADDPAKALAAYEPPHPEYSALKRKLAELRAAADDEEVAPIPDGRILKAGATDARVPLLRARLELPSAEVGDEIYDDALVEAVKGFQTDNGLKPDGIVGAMTLFALNGPTREDQIASIIANMERWRWLPRDLGATHVLVNVPEFMLRVRRDGKVSHETRVVVGTTANQTPLFSKAIDHLVVNPYWNVPTSIVTEEMLPEIQANPGNYFGKRGYQVLAHAGGKMRVVDPDTIDWTAISPRSVRIRQVPGDDNALGRIKFMFPNQHAVYLHDTPSKRLFEHDMRAYSHGCVRVADPLAFADAILVGESWDSTMLQSLYGGPERRIELKRRVPVHLAYFTARVEEDGEIARFPDIYGFDARIRQALGI